MWMKRGAVIYGGSLLLHAGVALAVVRIEKPVEREATRISISEVKKQKAEKAEPPPPPPPPPVVREARKLARKAPAPPPPAPAPAPAPAAAAPAQPVASFGLTLSGGVGMGAGGVAVPLGNSLRTKVEPTRKAAPKALVSKPAEEKQDGCLEALVKPRPISVPQPAYADRAREAGIQGKVRVELTVDETGAVVDAKILESLGYGLDEAALEAARASLFTPATRCGVATRTSFVIGIRFAL
jgi:periplasmic protein TonB